MITQLIKHNLALAIPHIKLYEPCQFGYFVILTYRK